MKRVLFLSLQNITKFTFENVTLPVVDQVSGSPADFGVTVCIIYVGKYSIYEISMTLR